MKHWRPNPGRRLSGRLKPLAAGMAFVLAAWGVVRADEASDPFQQGRELAGHLLAQRPSEAYASGGMLKIKGPGGYRQEAVLRCDITCTTTNWSTTYTVGTGVCERLVIVHAAGAPNRYEHQLPNGPVTEISGGDLMTPLSDSDFWLADLGLEFLHWPQQKVLRKEVKRSQGCTVLESCNPHPVANGYARVISWVDTENGGVVQAFAYDADNKLLKEFYPKDLKKVDGQWQVGLMEMENEQTGSRTRLEFETSAASLPQK